MTAPHCEPHWFADYDEEGQPPYLWAPFLETGEGHVPGVNVWFKTKADCDDWIDRYIVPAGREGRRAS